MKASSIAIVAGLCAILGACAGAPKEAAPSVVVLPPAPPPGEPAGIVGMDAQALRAAFGAPAFVRKDGPVEMWRYDNTNCRAFFFLYPNAGTTTVRHVETQPRGREMAADEACLAQLRVHVPSPVS